MPYTGKNMGREKARRQHHMVPAPVPREKLPQAVRSLENEELRALLVALLSEWRSRAEQGFNG